MAYAEYVEKERGFAPDHIYNTFVMPYCAEGDNTGLPKDDKAVDRLLKMRYAGFIYGDWKKVPDVNRSYHKIACILLDVKSVMQNYAASSKAQEKLAELVKKG